MALVKAQKQKILDELKEKIDKQKSVVFADFTGLKTKDLVKLRKEMKKNDCELKVAKKTLISLAFKGKKIALDAKKLKGEIALAFGYGDEIMPFKIIYNLSKENEKIKIIGGLVAKDLLDDKKAIELAQLPTQKELLAKLVGSLGAPISGIVNVLAGNLRNLVSILCQLSKVKTSLISNNQLKV